MKYLNILSLALTAVVCMVSSVAFAYNPEQLALFTQTRICEACDLNLLNATPNTLGQLDYADAVLSGSYLYGSSIEHLDLRRCRASHLNAVGLMLHDNDLTDADFSYSDITRLKVTHWNRGSRVRFTGASLSGSDFSYTEFHAPQFDGASLRNASLYRISWPEANLLGAALQSADVSFAQLQQANLEEADFTGATLSHADFTGANLRNAKISSAQLKTVLSVCQAILPDGEIGACMNIPHLR